MPSHRVKLNPALLVWARESAGYSVDALASALEQPPATISEWESGRERPTIRQLEKIANKVKRPLAAFFLPAPPREAELPRDFRTVPAGRLGHFEPATLLAFRKARNARQALLELTDPQRPRLPHGSMRDDVERLAASVRELLNVPVEEQLGWRSSYQAIARWREAVEQAGILTLQLSFPREDVRAFTLQDEPRLPVVAFTAKDSVEARIFSLFHEVGHIVLGQTASCNLSFTAPEARKRPHAAVERYCNDFSAALLLPNIRAIVNLLEEAVRAMSLENGVKRVATRCRVSRFVVLGRMFTLGLVGEDRFWPLFNQWSGTTSEAFEGAGGGDYYRNKLAEKGKTYTSAVLQALDSGRIDEYEAADYLECRIDHVDGLRNLLESGDELSPE